MFSSFSTLWMQAAVLLTNCWSDDIAARREAEDMAGSKHLGLIFKHVTEWKSIYAHLNIIPHINKNNFWVYVWIYYSWLMLKLVFQCQLWPYTSSPFIWEQVRTSSFFFLYCKRGYDFLRSFLNINML